MIVLSNKFLTVKLDESVGCAVSHLSESGKPNVLNTADKGRFIQASVYGVENIGTWRGVSWPENLVQCGSSLNISSTLISQRKNSLNSHVAKVKMIDWSTGKLSTSILTQTAYLNERCFTLIHKIECFNETVGPVRDQEEPAIFLKASYNKLILSSGTFYPHWNSTPPFGQYYDFDGFVAVVNKANYGIGIKSNSRRLTTYVYPGRFPCSYVAPLSTFSLTQGVFEYSVKFTIGSLSSILKFFDQ